MSVGFSFALASNDNGGGSVAPVAVGALAYTLGAVAEYHLSRELVLKASATHMQLVSNLPGASYASDTVLLGVRLQR